MMNKEDETGERGEVIRETDEWNVYGVLVWTTDSGGVGVVCHRPIAFLLL